MSKEVLENALLHYEGTILFISHDRYFINKIADNIAELTKDGLKVYLGDYDYYMEKKLEEAEIKKLEATKTTTKQNVKQAEMSFTEIGRASSRERDNIW